ncbi:MAG: phosphatase PAP2 family protein [Microthrixaceae bacterium]
MSRTSRSLHSARVSRRLSLLIATMAIAGALSYVVFVLTTRGQRFDTLAFEGRKATDLQIRESLTFMMRLMTPPGVVLGCVYLAVAAARRGRLWSGLIASASVVAAVALAEILKFVLPRPHLTNLVEAPKENTFPSGHSTAVLALVLAWVWIAPRCGRRPRVTLCVAGLITWMTAMVGSGWHRPSDVVGGIALATVVVATMLLSSELLGWIVDSSASDRGRPAEGQLTEDQLTDDQPAEDPPSVGQVAAAGVGAVLASAIFVMSILNQRSDPRHSLGTYLVMVLLCNALAATAVTLSWWGTGDSRPHPTRL